MSPGEPFVPLMGTLVTLVSRNHDETETPQRSVMTARGVDHTPADVPDRTRCGDSTITLTMLPSSSVCGRRMTFTATVVPVPPQSGTVTFIADGGPATSMPLHDGVATFTTALSAGAHTVTADYPGDECFNGAPRVSLTTWIWRTGFSDPARSLIPDPRSTPDEQHLQSG